MLAVVLTAFIPPTKSCSGGASTVIVIVPLVYPDPPSDIATATTLPPVDKTAVPPPVPELNAMSGIPV